MLLIICLRAMNDLCRSCIEDCVAPSWVSRLKHPPRPVPRDTRAIMIPRPTFRDATKASDEAVNVALGTNPTDVTQAGGAHSVELRSPSDVTKQVQTHRPTPQYQEDMSGACSTHCNKYPRKGEYQTSSP